MGGRIIAFDWGHKPIQPPFTPCPFGGAPNGHGDHDLRALPPDRSLNSCAIFRQSLHALTEHVCNKRWSPKHSGAAAPPQGGYFAGYRDDRIVRSEIVSFCRKDGSLGTTRDKNQIDQICVNAFDTRSNSSNDDHESPNGSFSQVPSVLRTTLKRFSWSLASAKFGCTESAWR
jgi:hypothetical protein